MKKLKLHLDDLCVESFHTAPRHPGHGTVRGLELCPPGDDESRAGTCDASCGGSCADTCDGTCLGDYTCGDWSCGPYCQSAGGYARYGCKVVIAY